jgi:hypothetical protein
MNKKSQKDLQPTFSISAYEDTSEQYSHEKAAWILDELVKRKNGTVSDNEIQNAVLNASKNGTKNVSVTAAAIYKTSNLLQNDFSRPLVIKGDKALVEKLSTFYYHNHPLGISHDNGKLETSRIIFPHEENIDAHEETPDEPGQKQIVMKVYDVIRIDYKTPQNFARQLVWYVENKSQSNSVSNDATQFAQFEEFADNADITNAVKEVLRSSEFRGRTGPRGEQGKKGYRGDKGSEGKPADLAKNKIILDLTHRVASLEEKCLQLSAGHLPPPVTPVTASQKKH